MSSSNMAACAVQRSYLRCRNGISFIAQHGNLTREVTSLKVYYGTNKTQTPEVHVPVDRLTVSYSRSSGPGGQHVNKVSTKAEVRFHVHTADWIPEGVRQKILQQNKNRINKSGELLVTSEISRSQQRNLSDCIQKISAIIFQATDEPHEPSEEDMDLRAARLETRNKERLKQKKIHSALKHSRHVDFD